VYAAAVGGGLFAFYAPPGTTVINIDGLVNDYDFADNYLFAGRMADYLRLHQADYILFATGLYPINGDYEAAANKIDIQRSLWYGGLRK
jgi:hypothetical protein